MSDENPVVVEPPKIWTYADADGQVFLLYEPLGKPLPLEPPITREKIKQYSEALLRSQPKADQPQPVPDIPTSTQQQRAAYEEIRQALHPLTRGGWFSRAQYFVETVYEHLLGILGAVIVLFLPYWIINYSNQHFPRWAQLIVLGIIVLMLISCLRFIFTEESRGKYTRRIQELFGARGYLVLPSLILPTAAAFFASVTFLLYSSGWVQLDGCAGRPVSVGSLTDFYVWHLLKLVPLLKLNETLKWNEPVCYSQARVGMLILIFQGLMVVPAINTYLYYWKHRRRLSDSSRYEILMCPPPDSKPEP